MSDYTNIPIDWRKVWLYTPEGVNYQNMNERARLILEFVATGIMPERATFFSFPISFADLKDIRSRNVKPNVVHALAMKLYDLETGSQVTDPCVVLEAVEQWEKSRSLPTGLSFHRYGIDTTGAVQASEHKPTLSSSQLRDKLAQKYRR